MKILISVALVLAAFTVVVVALAPGIHADKLPRVLLIGDSISLGYTSYFVKAAGGMVRIM